jgi:flagellin
MSLRIGTNVASLSAQRALNEAERQTGRAMRQIASGQRIVSGGDDAAGFAISERLRGQAASLQQAKNNSEGAVGLIQVAEGGLNEQNNILIRLRELAVQSASDTVSDEEREFLEVEFTQLSEELDRIAKTTTYGSKSLLVGTNEEFEFHLGTGDSGSDIVRFQLEADTRADSLGIGGLSVGSQDDAKSALSEIDSGLMVVMRARSGFGAIQSRLEYAGNNLDIQRENILAARSRIADADIAQAVSDMTVGQIRGQFATSVLAQANVAAERALRLL